MRRLLTLVLAGSLLVVCGNDGDPAGRPRSTVRFAGTEAVLRVEVADTTEERRVGLMGVDHLPADQGMAFVWDEPVRATFWMKDTLIPLTVAFVDPSGRVIGLRDMQPCEVEDCPSYGVDGEFVLAIEANLGWFADHGIGPGDRAELHADG